MACYLIKHGTALLYYSVILLEVYEGDRWGTLHQEIVWSQDMRQHQKMVQQSMTAEKWIVDSGIHDNAAVLYIMPHSN